jgi:hypothetical protein
VRRAYFDVGAISKGFRLVDCARREMENITGRNNAAAQSPITIVIPNKHTPAEHDSAFVLEMVILKPPFGATVHFNALERVFL